MTRTMTINIPSYKRANSAMKTLRFFPNARLWVAEFEAEEYRRNFPNNEIVVMPDSAQGLWSRARNYLLDNIDSDFFYILDDDLIAFRDISGPSGVRIDDPDELETIFYHMGIVAEEWGAVFWGLNGNEQPISSPDYLPFTLKNPIIGPVTGFSRKQKCRYDETVNIKSDWDMGIQQAVKTGKALRFNFFCYKAHIAEGTGGSAEARSGLLEVEHLKRLRQKWGDDIVKLLTKNLTWSSLNPKMSAKELKPRIILPIRGA